MLKQLCTVGWKLPKALEEWELSWALKMKMSSHSLKCGSKHFIINTWSPRKSPLSWKRIPYQKCCSNELRPSRCCFCPLPSNPFNKRNSFLQWPVHPKSILCLIFVYIKSQVGEKFNKNKKHIQDKAKTITENKTISGKKHSQIKSITIGSMCGMFAYNSDSADAKWTL